MSGSGVVLVAVCLLALGEGRAVFKRDTDLTETFKAVFETLVDQLIEAEGDEVSLPDVRDTFGGWWLNGEFTATGGVLGNLSSLSLESVTYTESESWTDVDLTLTLDPLQASFSLFTISTRFFSTSGSVSAEVVGDVIQLRVRISSGDTCSASLVLVRLRDYQDIEITSLEVGSKAEELFVWNMLEMAKSIYVDDIVSVAEKRLKTFLQPYMVNVCDLLSS